MLWTEYHLPWPYSNLSQALFSARTRHIVLSVLESTFQPHSLDDVPPRISETRVTSDI